MTLWCTMFSWATRPLFKKVVVKVKFFLYKHNFTYTTSFSPVSGRISPKFQRLSPPTQLERQPQNFYPSGGAKELSFVMLPLVPMMLERQQHFALFICSNLLRRLMMMRLWVWKQLEDRSKWHRKTSGCSLSVSCKSDRRLSSAQT